MTAVQSHARGHAFTAALLTALLALLAVTGLVQALPSRADEPGVGSITIHKHLLPDPALATDPADGLPTTPPQGATPLPGVVFTITPIDPAGPTITAPATDADGIAVVRDLPLGRYLVHEVGLLGADGRPDPGLLPARDFEVTIPLPDPRTPGAVLHDIHVYPKNSRLTLTKAVADGNAGVPGEDAPVPGRVLTYTLTADIPVPVDTSEGAVYELGDDLATSVVPGLSPVRRTSDFLEFAAADWTGEVTVSIQSDGGMRQLTSCAVVTPGCGYVLTQTASKVTISLTPSGHRAMAEAVDRDTRSHVVARLQARVRPTVADVTVAQVLRLPNTAYLIPTKETADKGGRITSDEVTTIYAALRLHKIDKATGSDLAGAVFTLYRTLDDAVAARDPLAVSEPSGADGMVVFPGLHVTDFENDAPGADSYWIVETGVPTGYVGLAGPVEVHLSSDGTTDYADGTGGLPVPNAPDTGGPGDPGDPDNPGGPGDPGNPGEPGDPPGEQPPLAWTGSDVGWLLVSGVALVVVGGLLAVAARRRSRTDDAEEANA